MCAGARVTVNKIIWVVWFQGWDVAPWLVRKCLASWQVHNPDWDIRALDARTLQAFIELPDLDGKTIGPAALSDIARICLLREYGGVWVDATVMCHRPLDTWLPEAAVGGFFAFDQPAPDRLLSSWFLAAAEDNAIIARWHAATLDYWRRHPAPDTYFWFHYLFSKLCDAYPDVRQGWARAVKIGAEKPHALQHAGLLLEDTGIIERLLADLPPVSKLTYRYDSGAETPGCLVRRLLGPLPEPQLPDGGAPEGRDRRVASLKVSTQNLGDHIQILAARRLLARTARAPDVYVDRDDEIASTPELDPAEAPYPIVLNGWFKTNQAEWPPGSKLDPVYIGFHIRLFQCPRLVAEEALEHYRQHQPIGCRDPYTANLLASHGIATYVSHCLTLTFPRRESAPEQQTEVFVVSRDDRILSWLPPHLKGSRYICHYVEERDFALNMACAEALLDLYRARAGLIVTSLLHCALPAIAMGIPVVMFYPENSEAGHASDMERFSSLADLVPIHTAGQDGIDWAPSPVAVGRLKLDLVTRFQSATARWNLPVRWQSRLLETLRDQPPPVDVDASAMGVLPSVPPVVDTAPAPPGDGRKDGLLDRFVAAARRVLAR
jgi:hypothetical protein